MAARFDLTVEMLRWTFPYILFVSLAALAAGVLNSYGKFAVPATTSTLMNVVMIVFAALIAPHFAQPGIALAIGVFVSGVVQLAFQLPFMFKLGLLRRPRWRWGHEGVQQDRPAHAAGDLWFVRVASGLVARHADRLVSRHGQYRVALLRGPARRVPARRVQHRAGHRDPAGACGASRRAVAATFAVTLDWAVQLTTIVVMPATVALLILAGPLTVTIFHYGKFDEQDVRMSTLALMAYSRGLMGFSMVKVLAPGFFARQDTKTPGAHRRAVARPSTWDSTC